MKKNIILSAMDKLLIMPFGPLLLALLLVASSCNRQDLEEEVYTTARIPIYVDWTVAGIVPQNVTVLFYDENDGNRLALEHKFAHNGNEVQSYVDVPVGKYTVVIFNELRDQVENVGVRGYDNLSTLEFYALENPDARSRSNDTYVYAPGVVASAVVRDFEVTGRMVSYTHDPSARSSDQLLAQCRGLMGVSPVRNVSQINITIHIKGLNNARMPALIDLRNISGGYLVGSNTNSVSPVRHQFTMNNRRYDEGSTTSGTISTKDVPIQLFGVLGNPNSIDDQPSDRPIMLDMLFMLVDKESTIVNRVIDVTRDIRFSDQLNGTITLDLDINLEERLPDVVPEGSTGDSSFGSTLEDWNNVEVPLIGY